MKWVNNNRDQFCDWKWQLPIIIKYLRLIDIAIINGTQNVIIIYENLLQNIIVRVSKVKMFLSYNFLS